MTELKYNDRRGYVEQAEDGMRLDRWAKRHWPDVPHGLLQKSARKGLLRLDGKRAGPESRIEKGQEVSLRGAVVQKEPAEREKTPYKLDAKAEKLMQDMILHQRPQLFVLNKPPGLAVQGGSGQKAHVDGMLEALQGHAPERPKLVHRLDRDTSGVLLIARDTPTAATLTKAFKEHTIQKVYWALVLGWPKKSRGKIELPLAKGTESGEKEKMLVDEENGLPAETHYRVVARTEYLDMPYAWVELLPISGRTHQLRVHLQAIGHPIVGDVKYGGKGVVRPGLASQLHLHARRLVMIEDEDLPLKSRLGDLDVFAPLPQHFKEALEAFGFPKDDDGVSLLEVGL